ncbi:MAG: hypothetical protein ACE5HV_00175 [Acidobacteriota bacterium]
MALHLAEMHEGSHRPEAIVLELSDEEIKKFKVGQKVTVTIQGSVGMLQVPPDGSSEEFPAEMGVRMTDKKIVGSNEFAELSEDGEEE